MRQWWDAFIGGGGAYAVINAVRWFWGIVTDDDDDDYDDDDYDDE